MEIILNEKHHENLVLDYLSRQHNCFVWKNQNVGIFDPTKKTFRKSHSKHQFSGVSDILGIFHARFLAIEMKSAKVYSYIVKHMDELRFYSGANKSYARYRDQIGFIDHIIEEGGIAFFASNLEEVKIELSKQLAKVLNGQENSAKEESIDRPRKEQGRPAH